MNIDLLQLYYKKYTEIVQASDYIEWAKHHQYMDFPEMKELASMTEPLNLLVVEKTFSNLMKVLQQKTPSKEQCIKAHLKWLHARLIVPTENARFILDEIHNCTRKHDLLEEMAKWQEIIEVIDRCQHENNQLGYTEEKLNELIVAHARKLWHTKVSEISCKELIGQKVMAVDSEINFILHMEKGSIVIECTWRIRDTERILIGETDIQSNQQEWKAVGELLIGKTIKDICLLEQCPLLILQIGTIFLDVFHASAFFDGWTLTDEEDFYLFSMHGGNIT